MNAQHHDAHAGPVMNYHRIDDRLVTGGHLVNHGSDELRAQGVTVVIDLRDDSPRDEQQRFADAGIKWINVPVEWRDPKAADFERFAELMNEHKDDHVLVQCAANYRASAMTYLYRVVVDGVPEDEAAKDLHAVWDPDENRTWREYIESIRSSRSD
ncbi:MAG: protein tyrosine phosphatase family protein [Woeseiaceae bacterium]|nr:protein tyrosine phosphatase family protein [Woeseiaceae bacterium]